MPSSCTAMTLRPSHLWNGARVTSSWTFSRVISSLMKATHRLFVVFDSRPSFRGGAKRRARNPYSRTVVMDSGFRLRRPRNDDPSRRHDHLAEHLAVLDQA